MILNKNKKLKMESRSLCKGERSSSDIISTLPEAILQTILCLLPTKEAARTSILSKEWRYKWTKIPKLEFGHRDTWPSLFDDINQVLLLRQAPIHEFILHLCLVCYDFEFDQIILHLSKSHMVNKLTLCGMQIEYWYELPKSVFSLHHLTDLCLSSFVLEYQPTFSGFGSLRSLYLFDVGISSKTLLHILSHCPSLKSLNLLIGESHPGDIGSTIVELFECLPMIEHLTTCMGIFEWFVLDSVPQKLPTLLYHLKFFCFHNMCFLDGSGLAFLLVLIKCSPNLERIKLQIEWDHQCLLQYHVIWERYSDVRLEHLNELEIDCFKNTKPEMEFVMFILARSPKLKRVNFTRPKVFGEEKLKMLIVLAQAPRLSLVRIFFES